MTISLKGIIMQLQGITVASGQFGEYANGTSQISILLAPLEKIAYELNKHLAHAKSINLHRPTPAEKLSINEKIELLRQLLPLAKFVLSAASMSHCAPPIGLVVFCIVMFTSVFSTHFEGTNV
jgi:hypothetical protein